MTKRLPVTVGLLAVFLLLMTTGLSCSEEPLPATLGAQFSLSVGQTALIESEGLKLTFVEVEEDSRCPQGVECVQAGQVTCRVRVNYKGAVSTIYITQPGGSFISYGTLGNYNVGFRVEPYPEAGKEIAESEYRLLMNVNY